eukprot:5081873-Pyramimonas_sp.AAC.1
MFSHDRRARRSAHNSPQREKIDILPWRPNVMQIARVWRQYTNGQTTLLGTDAGGYCKAAPGEAA